MLRKVVGVGIVGCVIALAMASVSVGQPQRGPGGGRPGFDPERMRQMMEERLQEQLGATSEEWKVIGPRLTKVMTLSRQTRGGAGLARMFMGRRGGPGAPGGRGEAQGRPGARGGTQGTRGGDRPQRRGPLGEPSAVDRAAEALQTTLANASATPDEIKSKLTALRAAREKAKQELAKAQQDLRQVLTLRQEAQLVVMGMLD